MMPREEVGYELQLTFFKQRKLVEAKKSPMEKAVSFLITVSLAGRGINGRIANFACFGFSFTTVRHK